MHIKKYRGRQILAVGVSLWLAACNSDTFESNDGGGDAYQGDGMITWPDTGYGQCKPGQDSDQDGIPDEVEGCDKDTDGDQIPDHMDTDSDGDQIPDSVEAGPDPKAPKDSDGDKVPDFQDTDSDNDGIKDGDEDLNGDGLLGCCLETCNEQREGCKPNQDGCGEGQECQQGKCMPLVDFLCSDGETDPAKAVTFPGGKPDVDLPSFICHPPGETSSKGLKPMLFKSSIKGTWKVALETTSTYGEIDVQGAAPNEAGATFDLTGAQQAVAGFVISMPAPSGDAVQVTTGLISKINTLPGKASVTQLSSGSPKTSHDNFQTVVMTQLAVKMSAPKNPPAVRNALLGLLLGKPVSKLPAANFGPDVASHILRFQTLLRTDGRILVMGAVGGANMANDSQVDTGIHMDDLSNGTGLAKNTDGETVECDPFLLSGSPVADIIWVVDESGSMNDNRDDVAANASDFFNRALKSGLDFRMAVTGVCNPSGTYCNGIVGKFCSVATTDNKHDGGPDRFLLPSEKAIFEACVKNPPGYEGGSEYGLTNAREAVKTHLPRAANDPTRVRPEATLVVIHATDEGPQSMKSQLYSLWSQIRHTCQLDASAQGQVNAFVQPDLDLFTGKITPQAKCNVHMIGGVCNNGCSAEIGHGYNEVVKATGGITADVCQTNLGATLQIIIDTITGQASPAKLEYVPISASLAVAVDKTQLDRSRSKGFDYAPSSNTLVFIGVPFPKGSQVMASYRRYKDQGPIIE